MQEKNYSIEEIPTAHARTQPSGVLVFLTNDRMHYAF